jgi:hypothetical protein
VSFLPCRTLNQAQAEAVPEILGHGKNLLVALTSPQPDGGSARDRRRVDDPRPPAGIGGSGVSVSASRDVRLVLAAEPR